MQRLAEKLCGAAGEELPIESLDNHPVSRKAIDSFLGHTGAGKLVRERGEVEARWKYFFS
jgi:hypothetical protein